jgi:hypothetical protein
VRFFIIKNVATTDTAMAEIIAPAKMPAKALVFKPDDAIVGNSAKKRRVNYWLTVLIWELFINSIKHIYSLKKQHQTYMSVSANEIQIDYDAS